MRAGIPARPRAWTEAERALVIAHQDRPTAEVAALVGRSVQWVDQMRSVLMAEGRIRAKIVQPRRMSRERRSTGAVDVERRPPRPADD